MSLAKQQRNAMSTSYQRLQRKMKLNINDQQSGSKICNVQFVHELSYLAVKSTTVYFAGSCTVGGKLPTLNFLWFPQDARCLNERHEKTANKITISIIISYKQPARDSTHACMQRSPCTKVKMHDKVHISFRYLHDGIRYNNHTGMHAIVGHFAFTY